MEQKEYVIRLTLAEVNIVLSGLGELPYKISMELVPKIHAQIRSQMSGQEVADAKDHR